MASCKLSYLFCILRSTRRLVAGKANFTKENFWLWDKTSRRRYTSYSKSSGVNRVGVHAGLCLGLVLHYAEVGVDL